MAVSNNKRMGFGAELVTHYVAMTGEGPGTPETDASEAICAIAHCLTGLGIVHPNDVRDFLSNCATHIEDEIDKMPPNGEPSC